MYAPHAPPPPPMTMSRRIECRSEGCVNEVFYKAVDDDRRGGGGGNGRSPLSPPGRGSPSGLHRHSTSSIQVSPYCKQHTCVHFHAEDRCIYKKPLHDTVCPLHARCPVPNCTQARAQFLEPNFDPLSSAMPRYARFDFCSDHKCSLQRCSGKRASRTTYCQAHACQAEGCGNLRQEQRNCCVEHQCKTRGCRTIVEREFPYCVIHIKCQEPSCGEARHFNTNIKEYLAYCTIHATCSARQCAAFKKGHSTFCKKHTCRVRSCQTATKSKPYCEDHCCAEPSCINVLVWIPESESDSESDAESKAGAKVASRVRSKTGSKAGSQGKFCPMHTCRAENCQAYVDRIALFCPNHGCSKAKCHQEAIAESLCIEHFKDHYISHGKRQASISMAPNGRLTPPRLQHPAAATQNTQNRTLRRRNYGSASGSSSDVDDDDRNSKESAASSQ
ncbi:hypothetical protein C8A05DRAFT_36776, partial [Staphylotrichum tortipilum]